ncbi:Thyrotropin receptor [Collichthys lucidus]|uniref:Thyrotropin receptor n=1 Tax=Collichthys lucidus TaxID=240159 RepID=A0A4U5V977_COLLU|nr:Thyrotropin receptor [Collichthys lucidus]
MKMNMVKKKLILTQHSEFCGGSKGAHSCNGILSRPCPLKSTGPTWIGPTSFRSSHAPEQHTKTCATCRNTCPPKPPRREIVDNVFIQVIPSNSFTGISENALTIMLNNNDVKEIQRYAFNGSSLEEVYLHRNVNLEQIDDFAFYGVIHGPTHLDLSETKVSSLPSIGMEAIEKLRAKNTWALKVLPPFRAFHHLQSAELTFPSHCCGLKMLKRWRGHSEAVVCNLTRTALGKLQESSAAISLGHKIYQHHHSFGVPLASSTNHNHYDNTICSRQQSQNEGLFYVELHTEHFGEGLDVALCNELYTDGLSCSPLPDALNPCEDVMTQGFLKVLVWVVSLLAISANFLVMFILLTSQQKLSVTRFLMGHLAFADFCMGMYLLLVASVDLYTRSHYYHYAIAWQTGSGCNLAGALSVFASELSVYTLTLISLRRWHAIFYAMRPDRKIRLRHAAVLMLFGWLLCFLLALLPVIGVSSYQKVSICLPMDTETTAARAYVVSVLIANIIAFTVVCLCYLHIFCMVHNPQHQSSRSDTSMAKRMAVLIFTNFLCLAPICFYGLSAALHQPLMTVTDSKACPLLSSSPFPLLIILLLGVQARSSGLVGSLPGPFLVVFSCRVLFAPSPPHHPPPRSPSNVPGARRVLPGTVPRSLFLSRLLRPFPSSSSSSSESERGPFLIVFSCRVLFGPSPPHHPPPRSPNEVLGARRVPPETVPHSLFLLRPLRPFPSSSTSSVESERVFSCCVLFAPSPPHHPPPRSPSEVLGARRVPPGTVPRSLFLSRPLRPFPSSSSSSSAESERVFSCRVLFAPSPHHPPPPPRSPSEVLGARRVPPETVPHSLFLLRPLRPFPSSSSSSSESERGPRGTSGPSRDRSSSSQRPVASRFSPLLLFMLRTYLSIFAPRSPLPFHPLLPLIDLLLGVRALSVDKPGSRRNAAFCLFSGLLMCELGRTIVEGGESSIGQLASVGQFMPAQRVRGERGEGESRSDESSSIGQFMPCSVSQRRKGGKERAGRTNLHRSDNSCLLSPPCEEKREEVERRVEGRVERGGATPRRVTEAGRALGGTRACGGTARKGKRRGEIGVEVERRGEGRVESGVATHRRVTKAGRALGGTRECRGAARKAKRRGEIGEEVEEEEVEGGQREGRVEGEKRRVTEARRSREGRGGRRRRTKGRTSGRRGATGHGGPTLVGRKKKKGPMRNRAEEMIMMRRRQQQQQQQRFAWRPHEHLWEHTNKKGRDPLLCKCLVSMGMYAFVDHFDNFSQFIRMSPDQCRLYGPEFVVRCGGGGGGGGGGGLIPCMEQFCWDDGFSDAQTFNVCSHLVGTCNAIERLARPGPVLDMGNVGGRPGHFRPPGHLDPEDNTRMYSLRTEHVDTLIKLRVINDVNPICASCKISVATDEDATADSLLGPGASATELRKPPTGSGTESGESTASDWKWFSLMDEAIAWGETPPVSASASPDSVPPEPECQGADSKSEEPAPPKRQRRDPVLELWERQEKRAEEREKGTGGGQGGEAFKPS